MIEKLLSKSNNEKVLNEKLEFNENNDDISKVEL